MIKFSRKPKVEFYSTIQGIKELMPIVEAKSVQYDWVKRAASYFTKQKSNTSLVKCPGIFAAKNEGWILRTWQDIMIEVTGNQWKYQAPFNQVSFSDFCTEPMSEHDASMMAQFFDNWPENTLKSVLKISTPWIVKIPKGYVLRQFHPPYLDEDRFTALPGNYTSDYGYAELTVPVLWHKKGAAGIKAGTPIAQFTLHKKEEIDFSVGCINDSPDIAKNLHLQKITYNSSYKRDYAKIKEVVSKL